MEYNNNDIIIAQATPIGTSALAIIRITGVDLSKLFKKIINKKDFKPKYNYLTRIRSYDNQIILDECVGVFYKGPNSFNGDDIVELTCHGGVYIVEKIIDNFNKMGIRLALPGEFSYRAFRNKKLDLMQAETIMEKINLGSLSFNSAIDNMASGDTSKKLKQIQAQLINIKTIIEHELDFNEEEIEHIQIEVINKKLKEISNTLKKIANNANLFKKIKDGYTIVICGYPNVGKSSLYNCLIGERRAIVTNIKGTTRDVNEAKLLLSGIPITLYDTAGYHESKDRIEKIGINMAKNIIKKSNILLVLDDNNPIKTKNMINTITNNKNQEIILIKSKCDNKKKRGSGIINISVRNNIGIKELEKKIKIIINKGLGKIDNDSLMILNGRQEKIIIESNKIIEKILQEILRNNEMDIIASYCSDFIYLFDELLGEVTNEDIINNIFKGFCVGK